MDIYDKNQNNSTFDFTNFNSNLENCSKKCDDMYKQVLEHQIKGAEISYVIIHFIFKYSIHIKST